MPIILETKQFLVTAPDTPHHDRDNGGHVVVSPKKRYGDRTEMPVKLYLAMMQLVALVDKPVIEVMRSKDIKVVRINYQDNGNWAYFPGVNKKPHVHVHLYMRTWNEKHPANDPRFRVFPDALVFPFMGDNPEYYESFRPYSDEDCKDIKLTLEKMLKDNKYTLSKSKL